MAIETIKKQLQDSLPTNHTEGYVADFRDNLIPTISVADFFDDLNNGDGNELESKFKALHSSSALCVNFFGFFKRHLDKFSFFGESNFTVGQFEKKLKTGLGGNPPSLVFYLENNNFIIGIESKFLEPLTPKQPEFAASYSDNFLSSIDNGLPSIVNHYRNNNAKSHLDTAQLIKHTIGLLNNRHDKKAKLIYVYWQPENYAQTKEYPSHQADLTFFSNLMKGISSIEFHHTTYSDLCKNYVANSFFRQHVLHFKQKYLLT
ncbi:hypothetical protein [Flavobacterium filum]|uniref:PGN_0703 family putative restriction endonuclease n=1 Tax=Flavobacterium filum TaxID=370974 RepID=UPI0023F19C76|nr:hypothetical protein [Flavobacterium filum]